MLFCTLLFPKYFENIASPEILIFLRLASWLLRKTLNIFEPNALMYQDIVILICELKSMFYFLS